MYHQQITEGNIIPNIDACWDELAAFHIGDSPGRQGAGHGRDELPEHLQAHPRQGLQGRPLLEHGRSKPGLEGEKAFIAAYRACDDF